MYGLYLIKSKNTVDNQTTIDHQKSNCTSNELYKGVLNENSNGIFNGKIYVRHDAQKTNAFQSNKNIVLSNESSIKTKPQLEILANDVKCSHSSTIGQIEEKQIFYLRCRGISKIKAKKILIQAFIKEITEKIENRKIKKTINVLINKKLKKYF